MAPTPQKPSTAGKGSIGRKDSRLSKKKLHQKAVKAALTQPDGERNSRKKRQKGRKQLCTLYRDILDIKEKLKLWDDSDEEDNMDYYNEEGKFKIPRFAVVDVVAYSRCAKIFCFVVSAISIVYRKEAGNKSRIYYWR